jgi:hypothetical protein
MATLTTEERCPTSDGNPKDIIENKNSFGGTSPISNDVPSFTSLYGFIREFRKPIKTLSFWSSDEHAVVSSEQVQASGLVEREASNEALPQLDATLALQLKVKTLKLLRNWSDQHYQRILMLRLTTHFQSTLRRKKQVLSKC